jgi:hypothetical protein
MRAKVAERLDAVIPHVDWDMVECLASYVRGCGQLQTLDDDFPDLQHPLCKSDISVGQLLAAVASYVDEAVQVSADFGPAPPTEKELLELLNQLATGEGGRCTGELKRRGWIDWKLTEDGVKALAASMDYSTQDPQEDTDADVR